MSDSEDAPRRAPETPAGHDADGVATGCSEATCQEAVARGDRWIGPHCSVEADGRAHFHHVQLLRTNVAKNQSDEFRRLCEEYAASPGDFVLAWRYLSTHPIFHRPCSAVLSGRTALELGDDLAAALSDAHVTTDDGLRDLWMEVRRDPSGGTRVGFEHGPHLWPTDVDKGEHQFTLAEGVSSHDPALNVQADSYEKAVVAMAAKVRARYGDDRSRVGNSTSEFEPIGSVTAVELRQQAQYLEVQPHQRDQ